MRVCLLLRAAGGGGLSRGRGGQLHCPGRCYRRRVSRAAGVLTHSLFTLGRCMLYMCLPVRRCLQAAAASLQGLHLPVQGHMHVSQLAASVCSVRPSFPKCRTNPLPCHCRLRGRRQQALSTSGQRMVVCCMGRPRMGLGRMPRLSLQP